MEMKRTTESRIISAGLLVMLVLLSLASARHFHLCLVRQMTQEKPVADCCAPVPNDTADVSHQGNDCHSTSNKNRDICGCALDSQPPIEKRHELDRPQRLVREDRLAGQAPVNSVSRNPGNASIVIPPDFQAGTPPILETLTCIVLLI